MNPAVALTPDEAVRRTPPPTGFGEEGLRSSRSEPGEGASEVDGSTDEALAQIWQEGSREAFAEVVDRHHARVFQFLYQATGRREDAEDLCQEAFLAADRSIRSFRLGGCLKAWLLGVARHHLCRYWRRRQVAEALPVDFEERAGSELDPAGVAEAGDESRVLWGRARRLKANQFQVLWLRYGEGLEVAAVAEAMGITQVHTKVLLYRARKELARRLKAKLNEGEGL